MPGSEALLDSASVPDLRRRFIRIYPCGTPLTKHVITNPIVTMDGIRASIQSYYTVYQATDDFWLQLICAGRYHDEFKHIEDVWRFTYRDYSLLDLVGDMRAHMNPAFAQP